MPARGTMLGGLCLLLLLLFFISLLFSDRRKVYSQNLLVFAGAKWHNGVCSHAGHCFQACACASCVFECLFFFLDAVFVVVFRLF